MQFFRKRLNKKGFTLIELIVVIAILGILAMIAIPRLAGFTEAARQANDEEFAAVIANAGAMYAASHMSEPGFVAADVSFANLAGDGLIDAAITTQALAEAELESTQYLGMTLAYNLATNVTTVQLTAAAAGGGAVLYTVTK